MQINNEKINHVFRVSDLRQLTYCERIPWLKYVLVLPDNPTPSMKRGKEAHIDFENLEKRRKFCKYGLTVAKRHFNVWLSNYKIGLRGIVDLVLETKINEKLVMLAVELKRTRHPSHLHHVEIQLIAYAMLLEATKNIESPVGFIYLIMQNGVQDVKISENAKGKVKSKIIRLKEIVKMPEPPEIPDNRKKCGGCEYRRFCDDIW